MLTVAWAPMQVTLPHDHRMGAVIGMYGGREDNMFWRRTPGKKKFQIEPAGGEALGTGNVTGCNSKAATATCPPMDWPWMIVQRGEPTSRMKR